MEIDGKTGVYGVIGDPISQSFSPLIHNYAFKYAGLNSVYLAFNVKAGDTLAAIDGAKALDFKGLSVAMPHKMAVIEKLDEIDPMVKKIGAINTLDFKDNKIKGYNTDSTGAVSAIKEITDLNGKNVLIVGAGGTSQAISFQLSISGVNKIEILNISVDMAKKLVNSIEKSNNNNLNLSYGGLDLIEKSVQDADIFINATPVGMYPNINEKPIANSDIMHSDLIVQDIVYNPIKTRFIKEAEKADAKAIPGIKMLLYEALDAFKIWTGVEVPINIIEKDVNKYLRKKGTYNLL
ncbi:MAG: shikimate dehydrogenase [Methanobrevibacter sp.]|jgi:shikimate dehydrogenase|nr:shikimate dehydrogenase [Methanobrevibacter sp.]